MSSIKSRRYVYRCAVVCVALAAAGVWVGYYRVAFYLPGMTIHRLRKIAASGGAA